MNWSRAILIASTSIILSLLAVFLVLSLTSSPEAIPRSGANPRKWVDRSQLDMAKVKHISWKPRLMVYPGFLSPEECEHIIKIGLSKVERSMTVGPNGTSIVNPHRTSYGYFLSRESSSDPVIQAVERRAHQWAQIPYSNGEAMNLLKYELGQEYKPHYDYFSGEEWTKHTGNRLATVLMYLSDVEEGGETIFPQAEGGAIKVKPRQGDAALFYDLTTLNKGDTYSLHGSVPVVKGTKWALTRWMREKGFR